MSPTRSRERRITALVVDDHTLLRKGLVTLLTDRGIEVVGEAKDGRSGIEQAVALRPDVILMDVNMPACGGIEATRAIYEGLPDSRVLMLTVSDDDEHLFAAVKAGARGYVLKTVDPDELVNAIERVVNGEAVIPHHMALKFVHQFAAMARGRVSPMAGATQMLTTREEDILRQLANGATNKEIARVLVISEHTVKIHLKNILKKLRVSNRTQAAIYAQRHGLVSAATPAVSKDSRPGGALRAPDRHREPSGSR
ncbi:MAG: response regulator [Nitrospirota bacterium]